MKLQIAILSAFVAVVFGYDNTTCGELPPGVTSDLIGMLTNMAVGVVKGCNNLQESDVKLLLYTRQNPNIPTVLNKANPIEIDSTKKVVLLIHGWISNPSAFLPEIKDAYLERYDCNVILVDWSKLALEFYTVSVCYLPKVAELMANFLCLLEQEFNIPMDTVHLVGHSLGGQMSGFIGQSTVAKCKGQVGRITALDPAGPLFHGSPESKRLDKSDAVFVDVIHTNAGILGYWSDCGDADFYVNCGIMQLGCPTIDLNPKNLRNVPVAVATCHHSRSLNYMAESICNSENFQAKTCETCPLPCVTDLLRARQTEIVMGEHCSNDATGGYVLTANSDSPYGVGLKRFIPSLASLKNLFN